MSPEHKKRVISAFVGLFVLLGVYFGLGHYGVVLATVVISTAAYYEFVTFSGTADRARWPSVVAGLLLSTWLCLELPGSFAAFYVMALAVLLRGLWRVQSRPPENLAEEFLVAQARVFGL
ncbi:MAG TPA: hypothetical protein VIH99_04735, partial [Bdellovibrionota bacterium]